MRIAGSQSRAQKITFVGETKQRMIADLFEVTIKGRAFLVSVDGVFGGIDIYDEPPLVSAPKQGVGGSANGIFKGFQTLRCCENTILKTGECGLACPIFMLFAQS